MPSVARVVRSSSGSLPEIDLVLARRYLAGRLSGHLAMAYCSVGRLRQYRVHRALRRLRKAVALATVFLRKAHRTGLASGLAIGDKSWPSLFFPICDFTTRKPLL